MVRNFSPNYDEEDEYTCWLGSLVQRSRDKDVFLRQVLVHTGQVKARAITVSHSPGRSGTILKWSPKSKARWARANQEPGGEWLELRKRLSSCMGRLLDIVGSVKKLEFLLIARRLVQNATLPRISFPVSPEFFI